MSIPNIDGKEAAARDAFDTPSPDIPASGMMEPGHEPQFSTDWEREDYRREKAGQSPLGPVGYRASTPDASEAAALAEFTGYFVRNYPGPHTVIGDPTWHAPKIFHAAHHAMRHLYATPPDYAKRIAELEGERDEFRGCLATAAGKLKLADDRLTALRSLVTEAAAVFGPALRIFDAVRLSAGIGKSQVERIDAAKALLTRLNEAVKR